MSPHIDVNRIDVAGLIVGLQTLRSLLRKKRDMRENLTVGFASVRNETK